MTGGLHNPYRDAYRVLSRQQRERNSIRRRYTSEYAWAVPNESATELVADHSPLVELGAGTGYWKYVAQQAGADVVAYDADPRPQWAPVKQGVPDDLGRYPDRALVLCWPPYDDPMAVRCLNNYSGSTLIYVGEPGGCTASPQFHDRLATDWSHQDTVDIPSWPGIHDELRLYYRR